MAHKACKCKETECEECVEWIFTFADLVMLLMGFFVILWVLKPQPGKKGDSDSSDYVVKIAAAIRGGFGYVPNPQSRDPVDMQMIIDGMSRIHPPGVGKKGNTDNEPKGAVGTEPDVTSIRPANHATEGGKMLFDRGSAALSDQTKSDLNQIAEVVRGHRNIVMVKGHTSLDDFPDGATDEQKMTLSLQRAQAAADYLAKKGVETRILRVQGCSTFEPLTERQYTPDAQEQNRRVEVEATNTLADDLQNKPAATEPSQ
ncbi:MAG TPA: OmpA family protein [Tepidisphaeraceae bacterium]|jgi:flagellar motor protein MotB|nr:OmpA family protein [Tepidisphaeraceae bacterium]